MRASWLDGLRRLFTARPSPGPRQRRAPLRVEPLEDRAVPVVGVLPVASPLTLQQLPFAQGVTLTSDGTVLLSYLNDINTVVQPFAGVDSGLPGAPLGQAILTNRGGLVDLNAGTLATVESAGRLPYLQQDDTLNLLQNGRLVALRPSTGEAVLYLDLRLIDPLVDRGQVFDVASGTVRNLSGAIFLASSTYNDLAIFQGDGFTDLWVSGISQSQAFPFLLRLRFANGELQDGRVAVTSTAGSFSGLAPGVAVNDDGTVLTTLNVVTRRGSTLTVPIAFSTGFPEGIGLAPFFPDFGPNNTALSGQVAANGVTTDARGNFILASDVTTNSTTGLPGVYVVTRDLRNLLFTPLDLANLTFTGRDVAVSNDGRFVYFTTDASPGIPGVQGAKDVYVFLLPDLPDSPPPDGSGPPSGPGDGTGGPSGDGPQPPPDDSGPIRPLPTDPDTPQTVGAFDPATGIWYLRNANSPGAPDITPFAYGLPGWVGLTGDWDGDGISTVGAFDPATGTWYLRNSNSPGAPDITPFAYGLPGWRPVAGDWDGDGIDTVGAFDPFTGTWFLRNDNSPGAPDIDPFVYGLPGWVPVVGDWDGDGADSVGVFDPFGGNWYLRNSNASGAPDVEPFVYGLGNWTPVIGDWDGDGTSNVGLVDPFSGTWYLRFSNSSGAPDVTPFAYGIPGWRPLAGTWAESASAARALDEAFAGGL